MVETNEKLRERLFPFKGIHLRLRRIVLWSSVAVYTFALPYAIVVYQSIETQFSREIAGKVPLIMILVLGSAYLFLGFMTKRGIRFLGRLVPCAIIAFTLISLESNPNKQIHIPEYILMSWLVFQALAPDYRGKGILILVFLISSMLGVVDELMQGVHPTRFFGWWDMIINSASAGMGVILLTGFRDEADGSWDWIRGGKEHKGMMGLGLLGLLGTVFTCIYLFKVKGHGVFFGVYPFWLLGWNGLFAALVPAVIFSFYFSYATGRSILSNRGDSIERTVPITGCLWAFPLLTILWVINVITLIVALSGGEFR
ncbi:MAG: VanZ family protein [Deltaproteobacteria bacterium]|nr:VanZ family protein [Deltaproteobacteria bacterium]